MTNASKANEDADTASHRLRGAAWAQQSRLKRKRYITGLEEDLSSVKHQNKALVQQLSERDSTIAKLEKEILYYRSVLGNVKEISYLVKTINNVFTNPCSTNLDPEKRLFSEPEPSLFPPSKKLRLRESSGETGSLPGEIGEDCGCDWISNSLYETSQLDLDFLHSHLKFSNEDSNLYQDVNLPCWAAKS